MSMGECVSEFVFVSMCICMSYLLVFTDISVSIYSLPEGLAQCLCLC